MKPPSDYDQGFTDGLRCFAINKDGAQYVGQGDVKLSVAENHKKDLWNYNPPKRKRHE